MRRSVSNLVTATLATALLSGAASAGEAPAATLKIVASPAISDAALAVTGSSGRYTQLDSMSVSLPLQLNAQMSEAGTGFRILKSELFLKAEGAGATARLVDTLAGAAPERSHAVDKAFAFEISPSGALAQDAISACNGHSAGQARNVRLPVAVVWRVTTGRFNFKWTGYDHVAPSDEMIANRDFYSDQTTMDAEAVIDVAVRCEPLAPQPASIAATRNDAPPIVSAAHFEATDPAKPKIVAQPEREAPRTVTIEPEAARVASVAQVASKPICDGGMVRQLSGADAGYLCLCPGNTERIVSGDNAFSCEKRVRRR